MSIIRYRTPELAGWSPFDRLSSLRELLDSAFQLASTSPEFGSGWAPALDVFEDDSKITVQLEAAGMKSFDETEWARTKSALREHLSSPRLHDGDLVNSRVVEEINQQPQRARPEMVSLRWLAWSGTCSLLLAVGLTVLVLPEQIGWRSDADFSSQVISARAELPNLSVSEFQAPDQRGVVLWVEGANYIPAEVSVK